MSNRSLSSLTRGRAAAAVMWLAALGALVSACSNGEQATSTPGTTPTVVDKVAVYPFAKVQEQGAPTPAAAALSVHLTTPAGKSAGTVTFDDKSGRVQVSSKVANLAAGAYLLRVHVAGNCQIADATGSAPYADAGQLSATGGGGIPVVVNADGTGELTAVVDSLKTSELVGESLVIESADAGSPSQLACGVISKG